MTGPVAAKLLNATVSGNSAGTGGSGGVGGSGSPSGAPGTAGATGVGGGVAGAAPASVTLQNTLLAANPLGNCAGSVSDGGHNLSFSDHTCPSTFSAGDPKLGTLRDNGGPTPTMALGGGSAAIDQIPTVVQCPATDQRGVARPAPAGGACDIGAYEVAAPKVAFQTVQGLSPKSVAVHVAVTANSGSGTVLVEYGRSTSLGHRTAARPIGGVNLARVSFTLRGLNLRQRRYYLRLVADTPDGETKTVELKLVVPILRSLRVNPRSFRTGGPHASTTLSYTDTRKAFTRFEVQRRQHGKWVTIGTFVHRDRAGRNRLSWRGRVGGHRLRPGHYRLLAVASANRVIRSPTITVDFRIRG